MKYADLSTILVKEIRKCVEAQFADLVGCGRAPNGMGDFSSSIALKTAKQMKKAPFEIAKEIVTRLQNAPSVKKYADRVEAKAPGFINFWLKPEFFSSAVEHIIKEGNHFGRAKKKKEKILLEFLSANPTGPMHMGNGRGGFTGDCLANVLDWAGYDVWREYYVNDTGNQVINLGKSIMAASGFYAEQEGEKLYKANYINDLVKELNPKKDDDIKEIGKQGVAIILKVIQRVAKDKMRIKYDQWYSEQSLYDTKKIDAILQWLEKENLIYEKDGARWFASSRFADEKDRVA